MCGSMPSRAASRLPAPSRRYLAPLRPSRDCCARPRGWMRRRRLHSSRWLSRRCRGEPSIEAGCPHGKCARRCRPVCSVSPRARPRWISSWIGPPPAMRSTGRCATHCSTSSPWQRWMMGLPPCGCAARGHASASGRTLPSSVRPLTRPWRMRFAREHCRPARWSGYGVGWRCWYRVPVSVRGWNSPPLPIG